MGKGRDGPTASIDALLQFLVETVYGPPEAATERRLQAFAAMLFAAMVRKPLRLPGSGLSLFGFLNDLRVLSEVDWNFPAAEICADLRKVFDHLAEWKQANEGLRQRRGGPPVWGADSGDAPNVPRQRWGKPALPFPRAPRFSEGRLPRHHFVTPRPRHNCESADLPGVPQSVRQS